MGEFNPEFFDQPWAILPSALSTAIARATSGVTPEAAAPRTGGRIGNIAVVPVQGVLRQKQASFIEEMFGEGGTSYERFAAVMRTLAADESIGTIVLDINSPGGSVAGWTEAMDAVFEARKTTHIVAVANSLAASAAYGIATQADELIATPTALVGSVGVVAMHQELSKMAEMQGVGITIISAGKYKAEVNDFEPLTQEARDAIQAQIDQYYTMFINAVARGRDVKAADVRAGYGEGRVVTAGDAKKMGMIDRVGTMRDVLAKMGAAPGEVRAASWIDGFEAVTDDPPIAATADDHETQLEAERWQYARIGA